MSKSRLHEMIVENGEDQFHFRCEYLFTNCQCCKHYGTNRTWTLNTHLFSFPTTNHNNYELKGQSYNADCPPMQLKYKYIYTMFITNNNVRKAAVTTVKCEQNEETIMRSFAFSHWLSEVADFILFYYFIVFYVIGKKEVHSMQDFLFGVRMSSSCQSDLDLASNARTT